MNDKIPCKYTCPHYFLKIFFCSPLPFNSSVYILYLTDPTWSLTMRDTVLIISCIFALCLVDKKEPNSSSLPNLWKPEATKLDLYWHTILTFLKFLMKIFLVSLNIYLSHKLLLRWIMVKRCKFYQMCQIYSNWYDTFVE